MAIYTVVSVLTSFVVYFICTFNKETTLQGFVPNSNIEALVHSTHDMGMDSIRHAIGDSSDTYYLQIGRLYKWEPIKYLNTTLKYRIGRDHGLTPTVPSELNVNIKKYGKILYTKNKTAFTIESIRLSKNFQPVQLSTGSYLSIGGANRDNTVFGGKYDSVNYTNTFDPSRDNLDRVIGSFSEDEPSVRVGDMSNTYMVLMAYFSCVLYNMLSVRPFKVFFVFFAVIYSPSCDCAYWVSVINLVTSIMDSRNPFQPWLNPPRIRETLTIFTTSILLFFGLTTYLRSTLIGTCETEVCLKGPFMKHNNIYHNIISIFPSDIKLGNMSLPMPLSVYDGHQPTTNYFKGLDIASFNHDDAPRDIEPIVYMYKNFLKYVPYTYKVIPFESKEIAQEAISNLRFFKTYEATSKWETMDTDSDELVEMIALEGFGASRLDVDGEGFKCDATDLAKFPVKPGKVIYGAAAYFNSDMKLTSIFVSHLDEMIFKGDRRFRYAKSVWRTSIVTAITVAEHLTHSHLIVGNQGKILLTENLPVNHPISRFMRPFTYGLTSANIGIGDMYISETGTVTNTYDFEDLLGAVQSITNGYKPNGHIFNMAVLDRLGERYAFGYYGVRYEQIVTDYVDGFFDIYESEESKSGTGESWEEEFGDLRGLIIQYIVRVTGYHSHVGDVTKYAYNYNMYCPKIYDGNCSVHDVFNFILVVIATNNRNTYTMTTDFSHMFTKDEHYSEVVELYKTFHASLLELSSKSPSSFNPDTMGTAVNR